MRLNWLRKFASRLALCLVLGLALCASAMAEDFPYTAVLSGATNLRRSASSAAQVVCDLPQGALVTVTGSYGQYCSVSYNGESGYVLAVYLQQTGVGDTAVLSRSGYSSLTAFGYPYDTITIDQVNLRAKASVSADRITSMPKGVSLTVHDVAGEWAYVTYQGKSGYAMAAYLQVKQIVTPTPMPPATPLPTSMNGSSEELNHVSYNVLQEGSTGADVKALEQAMAELGFFTGTPDETFDSATRKAAIALQEKNQYPATGVVDANLQAFIYNGKVKNSKGKTTEVMTLSPVENVVIRKGNTGDLVYTVQARLAALRYYEGEYTGVYDKATIAAVRAFQKKNGIKADGLCGEDTQALLLYTNAIPADATPTPKPTKTPKATKTPKPTATPKPLKTPAANVAYGSRGADAKLVQQRLKTLGYLSGSADGQFGSESVSALKDFQFANGLYPDGVAGSGTIAVLFSYTAIDAQGESEAPTPTPTPYVTPTPTPTLPPVEIITPAPTMTPFTLTPGNATLITLGVSGEAVRQLQRRLTELGYYTSNLDGVCRDADVAAIRLFQQRNGLTVDGKAGYETQAKLFGSSAVAYTDVMFGQTVVTYVTLRMGDTGDAVKRLQNRLIELGYLYGTADGKYGSVTAAAVTNFQRANGLVRDGVAGEDTQAILYASSALTPTPAPTATPAPAPGSLSTSDTLREGQESESVRVMQQMLIDLGYLSGQADGKFGYQTAQALRRFQRENKLTADGVAGSATIAALNGTIISSVTTTPAVATPTPTVIDTSNLSTIDPSTVIYANWYSKVRAVVRKYQYATVYDYQTGASWQVHMFSFGNHAEAEPLTAADTAKMEADFGGNTWDPKPVWVVLGNGEVYIATTHSMPHQVQHITDNDFPGHLCIHFPRTSSQVSAIGPYATRHQTTVDQAWKAMNANLSK